MWPFTKKEKLIWKEQGREWLRRESNHDFEMCTVEFDYYAVTYKDLISNKIKIEEVCVFV